MSLEVILNWEYETVFKFGGVGFRNLDLVYIEAEPGTERVWLDTYGGDDDDKNTTFAWMPPDYAEALGQALIKAARIARGDDERPTEPRTFTLDA